MTFLAFVYAYAGLTSLGLAMNRHYRQVWNDLPAMRVTLALRLVGWMLLVGSLIVCTMHVSWSIGVVHWIGSLSAAAIVLIFLLPYEPRAAATLAVVAPVTATVLLVAL